MRWPTTADQLYRVLEQICHAPAHNSAQNTGAIDPVAFSTLEKSLGTKSLIGILQCYIVTAEQLTGALTDACRDEKWDEATRLAQDIIGAAGGLGLCAITGAAREFARKAREGDSRDELRDAAQSVAGEHVRTRQALRHLYPDVA